MLNIQLASLDWSLKHALSEGDTDVFPVPFEYTAIEHDWQAVSISVQNENVLDWITRPSRTLLSPKAQYGFRSITQLDPIDFLIYTSLVYEVCDDLESRRIPISDNRVFSYRVETNSDGQLFSRSVGYRQFLNKCREKTGEYGPHCVIATSDIADFYSRIYHHRLENSLLAATDKVSHVKGIMKLLSGWNGSESYGIPVGCSASGLLAELTLVDVDEALLAHRIDFIRYNDDYRIFSTTKKKAYQDLALLADILHKNHGLTLQQSKTQILPAEDFTTRYLSTPIDREMDSLYEKFALLVEELELDTAYEEFEYDDLNEEQQELIDSLNLVDLLKEEVSKDAPDLPVIRFCLRRLGQLGDENAIDDIFEHIESITPVFVEIVEYFSKLRHLNSNSKSRLGGKMLDLLNDSMLSALPYHRMWILQLFTESTEWDNENRFQALYNDEIDQACRRKLILAMGRANQTHWFQSQWRSLFEHPSWQRRAVIAAGSCMPGDARRHWFRSIESQLDVLELAVMRWARTNPFGGN